MHLWVLCSKIEGERNRPSHVAIKDKRQARWHSCWGSKHHLGLLLRQSSSSCLCIPGWSKKVRHDKRPRGRGTFALPEANQNKTKIHLARLTRHPHRLCCPWCSRPCCPGGRCTRQLCCLSTETTPGARRHKHPPSYILWLERDNEYGRIMLSQHCSNTYSCFFDTLQLP